MTSRRWYAVAAMAAGSVALVFATVGDGVDDSSRQGVPGLVLAYGHTATWVLLSVSLGLAAARGTWGRVSGAAAVAAGLCYAGFVLVVLGG